MSNHLILSWKRMANTPNAAVMELEALSVDLREQLYNLGYYHDYVDLSTEEGSLDATEVLWWLGHSEQYLKWSTSTIKVPINIVANRFNTFVQKYATPTTTVWGNITQHEQAVNHLLGRAKIPYRFSTNQFADFNTLLMLKRSRMPEDFRLLTARMQANIIEELAHDYYK